MKNFPMEHPVRNSINSSKVEKKSYPEEKGDIFSEEKKNFKFEMNVRWINMNFDRKAILEDIKQKRKIIEKNLDFLKGSGYKEEGRDMTEDRAKLRALWELENMGE